jgi:L-amino acid N-acyltransferase YncA
MIQIRNATVEDAEGIASILNSIIDARIYTALDTTVTVEQEREFISRFPERGIFHVAVDDGTGHIVGFQDVEPFAAFTRAFDHVGVIGTYVALDRQRQGIGGALFAATFEAARRKGYEKLFSYVRADNEAGLNAYRKQGFRELGTAERHARIDGRYIDEILIERFLP